VQGKWRFTGIPPVIPSSERTIIRGSAGTRNETGRCRTGEAREGANQFTD